MVRILCALVAFVLVVSEARAAGPEGPAPSLLPQEECAPGQEAPCPQGGGMSSPGGPLAPGARAEPFVLSGPGGEPVIFSPGESGKPALVLFWSLFCPPCREEMPYFAALARRYGPRGLEVISINVDGPDMARAVERYAARENLPFPVGMDEKEGRDFVFAKAYGVTGTPALFLVAPDGTVKWSHEGRVDPGALEAEIQDLLGASAR